MELDTGQSQGTQEDTFVLPTLLNHDCINTQQMNQKQTNNLKDLRTLNFECLLLSENIPLCPIVDH